MGQARCGPCECGGAVPGWRRAAWPVGGAGGYAGTPRRGAGDCDLGLGRGAQWYCHGQRPSGGRLCAANAQLRVSRRRQLQKRLLPGPGGGGTQPVPRHPQAPRFPGPCRRSHQGGRRDFPGQRARSALRHRGSGRCSTRRSGKRLRTPSWRCSSARWRRATCTWAAPPAQP